jgi:tetratricopeptide (TPR) repeat protein
LKERMSEPGIHKDLDNVHFGEPNDLLSTFIMADDDLAHFVSGYDAASDERPLGFLNAPDFGSRRDVQTLTDDLISHRASIYPYLHNIGASENAEKNVRDALEAQATTVGNVMRGGLKLLFHDPEGSRKEIEQALRVRDDWKEARFQYSLALAAEAERVLDGANAGDAITLLEKAITYAEDYAPNYVLLGRAYEKLGQPGVATEYFYKATNILEVKGYPPIPFVQQKLAESRKGFSP